LLRFRTRAARFLTLFFSGGLSAYLFPVRAQAYVLTSFFYPHSRIFGARAHLHSFSFSFVRRQVFLLGRSYVNLFSPSYTLRYIHLRVFLIRYHERLATLTDPLVRFPTRQSIRTEPSKLRVPLRHRKKRTRANTNNRHRRSRMISRNRKTYKRAKPRSDQDNPILSNAVISIST